MTISAKRLIATSLAACLIFSLAGQPAHADGETTATLTSAHVRYLGGYEDRSVRPENPVTRAEAAAMLYRLLENPESGTGTCSYVDVHEGDWFASNVRGG